MTAMKDALEKAGVEKITVNSPENRLSEIALKAMVTHADNTRLTIDAIWDAVQKDRVLLIELFRLWRNQAIGSLLYRTRVDLGVAANRGQIKRPIERRALIVVNNLKADDERLAREKKAAAKREQDGKDAEYQRYLEAWQKTAIGDLYVSGVPVWQVTPGTARLWAANQTQRWKVVELLTAGLPDDGRPIEYYRRPEDVAEIWRRVRAEDAK